MIFRKFILSFIVFNVAKAESDVSKDKPIQSRALEVAELLNRNRKLSLLNVNATTIYGWSIEPSVHGPGLIMSTMFYWDKKHKPLLEIGMRCACVTFYGLGLLPKNQEPIS